MTKMAEVKKQQPSEAELIKLGQKYLENNDKQRQRAYKYFETKREDPDFIERGREARRRYYHNHREKIREALNKKYKEDKEYYNKIRTEAKARYAEKKSSTKSNIN